MQRLNALERYKVREEARKAWMEANGDPDRAEQIFKASQPVGINEQLLALLISIALRWFEIWIKNREVTPQVVMTTAEAMAMGEESD